MRRDLTEVVVILDCSGSMAVCKSNIENGLNDFLRKQKELPGTARLTLVNFSDNYNIKTVVNGLDIKQVDKVNLEPRGNTALLDAIASTIDGVGQKLASVPESERPGLVTVAIVTDGYENDSKKFTKQDVKERIRHQNEKYNWQFLFLGANQDAIESAADLAINPVGALNFGTASQNWSAGLMGNISRGRLSNSLGIGYLPEYTEQEVLAAVK